MATSILPRSPKRSPEYVPPTKTSYAVAMVYCTPDKGWVIEGIDVWYMAHGDNYEEAKDRFWLGLKSMLINNYKSVIQPAPAHRRSVWLEIVKTSKWRTLDIVGGVVETPVGEMGFGILYQFCEGL